MKTRKEDMLVPLRSTGDRPGTCALLQALYTVCVCISVPACGYKGIWKGRPCTLESGSHDSLGCHIHLRLFAKFDFKYLSHHTSWLKQIAGKVLLSGKHVVRRMEVLEETSMFHLVKYMTGKCMCNYSSFQTGGWYRSTTFWSLFFLWRKGGRGVFWDEILFIRIFLQLYNVCGPFHS